MGKNPAFLFFPNDWSRDLEEHPLEIEGAWIRICCKLWYSETKGKLTKTVEQWGRVLRTNTDDTLRILNYIKNEKIGNISGEFANCNDFVTVMSRRMQRDEKERELTRLRVKKHRSKKDGNGPVTGKKQCTSVSASVHASFTNVKEAGDEPPPTPEGDKLLSWEEVKGLVSTLPDEEQKKPGHFEKILKPRDNGTFEKILEVCKEGWREPKFPFQFIQRNKNSHPKALLHVLDASKKRATAD